MSSALHTFSNISSQQIPRLSNLQHRFVSQLIALKSKSGTTEGVQPVDLISKVESTVGEFAFAAISRFSDKSQSFQQAYIKRASELIIEKIIHPKISEISQNLDRDQLKLQDLISVLKSKKEEFDHLIASNQNSHKKIQRASEECHVRSTIQDGKVITDRFKDAEERKIRQARERKEAIISEETEKIEKRLLKIGKVAEQISSYEILLKDNRISLKENFLAALKVLEESITLQELKEFLFQNTESIGKFCDKTKPFSFTDYSDISILDLNECRSPKALKESRKQFPLPADGVEVVEIFTKVFGPVTRESLAEIQNFSGKALDVIIAVKELLGEKWFARQKELLDPDDMLRMSIVKSNEGKQLALHLSAYLEESNVSKSRIQNLLARSLTLIAESYLLLETVDRRIVYEGVKVKDADYIKLSKERGFDHEVFIRSVKLEKEHPLNPVEGLTLGNYFSHSRFETYKDGLLFKLLRIRALSKLNRGLALKNMLPGEYDIRICDYDCTKKNERLLIGLKRHFNYSILKEGRYISKMMHVGIPVTALFTMSCLMSQSIFVPAAIFGYACALGGINSGAILSERYARFRLKKVIDRLEKKSALSLPFKRHPDF